jgi:hypothetical protein
MSKVRCIGIDPAPGKPTVVCEEREPGVFHFEAWEPHEVRAGITKLLVKAKENGERLVVTWDAPLRLDRGAVAGTRDYASRLVDNAVASWKKSKQTTSPPLLGPGAVGVANAASCPHNLLTQHVWGLPVGEVPEHGAHLVLPGQTFTTVSASCMLAEVHPAVALAAWWVGQGKSDPMPRYKDERKGAREGLCAVAEFLGLPVKHPSLYTDIMKEGGSGQPDDRLDAWIAWRLAHEWTQGTAHPVGAPDGGSYLLPTSLAWDVLHGHLSTEGKAKLAR